MRLSTIILALLGLSFFGTGAAYGQQEKPKDPCSDLRFMPLSDEAPTVTATDVRNLPQCVAGKFIRLVGIYRISFENSDLYDPTGDGGGAWVTFDPFYSAVKRCSDHKALRLLDRKHGGTFGFVAMGILRGPEPPKDVDPNLPAWFRERLEQTPRTPLGYGHMNAWPNEFQVICLEEVVFFSGDGSLFEHQKPDVRKRILEWYAKDHSP
ncbi:MAG: hypothetical protein ACJ741_07125 [Pyrinomonadaceae bacterium]